MNHNKLEHLNEGIFQGMPKLTTLYLDQNMITTIHNNAFVGLEANLQSLSLASNQLQEFPSSALRPVHELTTLHIDDNKIERIDNKAFEGFGEHIKFLWLQNNRIKDIPPEAFQDLHSLEWIKLYNNLLTTLHYELMEPVLDTLQHIDIHSKFFKVPDWLMSTTFHEKEKILWEFSYLHYNFLNFPTGNPLVCDCELRWYHQWIEEEWNPVEEEWLKDTFCLDPADHKQHNIAEVPLKDMFCTGDVKDKPSARVSNFFAKKNFLPHDIITLFIHSRMMEEPRLSCAIGYSCSCQLCQSYS